MCAALCFAACFCANSHTCIPSAVVVACSCGFTGVGVAGVVVVIVGIVVIIVIVIPVTAARRVCMCAGQCALLKVQASKTFEFCAREASQIFGGSSIVKEGRGKLVERMYREVRASAIPGGSEEILLDFAMRQAFAAAKKQQSKL